MGNYHNTLFFPCLCADCKTISRGNILAEKLVCRLCGSEDVTSYSDPKLRGSVGAETVTEWGRLKLDDGTYKCPSCGKFDLVFSQGELMFD